MVSFRAMGHAVHFLQRLARLSAVQMDMALGLYRDPALVRYVVQQACLPEGVERFALALEQDPNGPHIILARDGGFVTCLGKGMSIGSLPRVSRSRLDEISKAVVNLRAVYGQAEEYGETERLFHTLAHVCHKLSREDFLSLSMLFPLFMHDLLVFLQEAMDEALRFRQLYRRSHFRRLTSDRRELLQTYWQTVWSCGHLCMVYGHRMKEIAPLMPPDLLDSYYRSVYALSRHAINIHNIPIALRGLWLAAAGGPHVLPLFAQALHEANDVLSMVECMLALVAIGMGHESVRAEVVDHLEQHRQWLGGLSLPALSKERAQRRVQGLIKALGKTEQSREAYRVWARKAVVAMAEDMVAEGHRLRFQQPEDVPEDLELALICSLDGELLSWDRGVHTVLTILPHLSRAPAELMYIPAEALQVFRWRWSAENINKHLASYNRLSLLDRPAKAKPKPGRNQVCSCGSGKKYKRCCGADAGPLDLDTSALDGRQDGHTS